MSKSASHGGKRSGAGRKPKSSEEELQSLLDSGWPKKERKAAIKKYAERASKGDLESFKVLMAYTYGKPKEKHELTGKDGKDLNPVLNVFLNAEPTASEEADDS